MRCQQAFLWFVVRTVCLSTDLPTPSRCWRPVVLQVPTTTDDRILSRTPLPSYYYGALPMVAGGAAAAANGQHLLPPAAAGAWPLRHAASPGAAHLIVIAAARLFLPLGVISGERIVTVPGPAGASGFGCSGDAFRNGAALAAFRRPTDGGLASPDGDAWGEGGAARIARVSRLRRGVGTQNSQSA